MKTIMQEYLETGKDLNSIMDKQIKSNNRQWFLLIVLLMLIWIGYGVIQQKRIVYLIDKGNITDSINSHLVGVVKMQKEALDSAVYFRDIK